MVELIVLILFIAAGYFFGLLAKFEEWLDWYEHRNRKKK